MGVNNGLIALRNQENGRSGTLVDVADAPTVEVD